MELDITWDQAHAALAQIAQENDEWCGIPIPPEGESMVVHPSYSYAHIFNNAVPSVEGEHTHVCRVEDVESDDEVRNEWMSARMRSTITIWRKGRKFGHSISCNTTGTLTLKTMGAYQMWDVEAELRAMESLREKITAAQFKCYILTGAFLWTSPRSHVCYMFRRLRPTIAFGTSTGSVTVLCCLCIHPLGYLRDTWAGVLCPTDNVLAHYLLARSDEHLYWKQSEQHAPYSPLSGI